MLFEQDAPIPIDENCAAAALVAHLPHDQALGLRLLALAHAAAAMHMAELAVNPRASTSAPEPAAPARHTGWAESFLEGSRR